MAKKDFVVLYESKFFMITNSITKEDAYLLSDNYQKIETKQIEDFIKMTDLERNIFKVVQMNYNHRSKNYTFKIAIENWITYMSYNENAELNEKFLLFNNINFSEDKHPTNIKIEELKRLLKL